MHTRPFNLVFFACAIFSCSGGIRGASQQTNPPTIGSFTTSPTAISAGQSSMLSWSVSGASSINIDNGIGSVASSDTRSVTPAASAIYMLTATNTAGTVTASVAIAVTGSAADATISVDTSQDRRSISPFVYGYNAGSASNAPPGATWLRLGGNRWTAYNWTNNYSNAGSDYGPYYNDNLMGSPADGPGHAAVPSINDASAHGLGLLVTIPIQGWASKVRLGNVVLPTDPITDWFVPNQPRKGSPFTLTPDPNSSPVWQDEFANCLSFHWGTGPTPIHISLDNEPDLWSSTHAEIQRSPLRYTDLLSLSIAGADAIKQAVPSALIFGPVSYGWAGYVNLQNAPDASQYGDFLNYYLDQMSAAQSSRGRRLLDVLDLHFYSESYGCGTRVNDSSASPSVRNSDCVVAARVQATRSLWDSSYLEPSWITRCCSNGQGIQLVPRMFGKIAAHYAGTKLAITEYNHGGGDHISGAVAEADSLGAMGREGVFAASYWPLLANDSWTFAAFRAFRNYDALGNNYPSTAVRASSGDIAHVASYAGFDSTSGRVVVVLVHRPGAITDAAGNITGSDGMRTRTVLVQVTNSQSLPMVRAWQLTGGSAPVWTTLNLTPGNPLTVTLPPLSVTTIELKP